MARFFYDFGGKILRRIRAPAASEAQQHSGWAASFGIRRPAGVGRREANGAIYGKIICKAMGNG
jgi:hypothetical protein